MSRVSVLVADAQVLFAEALAIALERHPGLRVLPQHPTTAHETVAAIAAAHPDVALVDYALPGMDPPAVVQTVRVQAPATKVVHLSWSRGPDGAEQSLAAGAAGFLPKSLHVETVADAVRRAHLGGPPVTVGVGTTIVEVVRPELSAVPDATARLASLTSRQLEVLHLLAAGLAAREIAEQLGLTVSTVRTHVHRILARTGTRSQLEAVALARQAGFLP